jgi:methylmalonyl-CoA epimerase
MIKKLDHIGIAVSDLKASEQKYKKLTGVFSPKEEFVPTQKVEVAFYPVGESRLELLQGTAPDSPISKFIEKKGEGIHHLCFEVDDLSATKTVLEKTGIQFIDNISDEGAGGTKVAFIHPKSMGGILIELVEYPES